VTLRLLIVAPEIPSMPRLAQVDELTRLADVPGIVRVSLVGPLVTEQRIQAQLRNNSWNLLLWSGHGADGRLLLPDGSTVEPRWLASEARRAGVNTAILAVCDSAKRRGLEGFADVLPAAGINLVAMTVTIKDVAAVDYDVALLHALANGETLREAHRIGIEAIQSTPDAGTPQLYMADAAASLKAKVAQIDASITNGDNAEALQLARQFVAGLEDHEVRISAIERQTFPSWQVRAWQLAAIIIASAALALFFVSDTRAIIYRPIWVGAIIDVALIGWAVLMWRMAITTRERDK